MYECKLNCSGIDFQLYKNNIVTIFTSEVSVVLDAIQLRIS